MSDILVTRSSMPPFDEYTDEIKDLWKSHWLTNNGVKAQKFRDELCAYLEIKNLELTVNGHMALEIILQVMDFPKGGEVITTPFTFVSTTHAIVRSGLKPVFCDINSNDYTIDVSKIESLITDKTCAILPVHVYGNVCDVEAIDEIAKKHDLKVIYDAAHAFSVKYKGRPVTDYGDASIFSFHATKVFNTIEGGAICYNDENLGDVIREFRDFGICDEEAVDFVGPNAKMNEFCAAMGLCNLRHVDEEIEKRKVVVEKYRELLEPVRGIRLNCGKDDLRGSYVNHTQNYAYFPIIVEDEYGLSRDELHDKLVQNGIRTRKYFYPLTSAMKCYCDEYNAEDTPVALDISNRVLTLPLYADLSVEDVEKICRVIGSK